MKLKFDLGKYFVWCYYHNVHPREEYFRFDNEPLDNLIDEMKPEWCSFIKSIRCPHCGKEIEVK